MSATKNDSMKRDYPTYDHECEDLKNKLNRQLRRLRATDPAERAFGKGTKSKYYTTEMAYMLDEIQRGAVFVAPQIIRKATDLVGDLESYLSKQEAEKQKTV